LNIIVCQGLSKKYGKILALDNLDLEIEKGTLFGFLGPNGAGKTTALRIMVGLSQATGGKAWICEEEVKLNSSRLQKHIGYLPEEPAFYSWMTGREFLYFTGRLFQIPFAEIKSRADILLELVGLTEAGKRRIGSYSRGMKQRLGIAQALINQPEVLLLDEPCSALDPVGRLEVLETLLKLKEHTTIIMSSHILSDIERVCDEVAILNKGRLIVKSRIEELRQRYAQPLFELEFDQINDSIRHDIQKIPCVKQIFESKRGDIPILRIRVENPVLDRKALLEAIVASNMPLRRYEMLLPNLEEVFVSLVGNQQEKS